MVKISFFFSHPDEQNVRNDGMQMLDRNADCQAKRVSIETRAQTKKTIVDPSQTPSMWRYVSRFEVDFKDFHHADKPSILPPAYWLHVSNPRWVLNISTQYLQQAPKFVKDPSTPGWLELGFPKLGSQYASGRSRCLMVKWSFMDRNGRFTITIFDHS